MDRFVIKITDNTSGRDYYLQWSSISNSPITFGMPLDEFKKFYEDEYGSSGREFLENNLPLVESIGSSSGDDRSVSEIVRGSKLTMDFILDNYCRSWVRGNEILRRN